MNNLIKTIYNKFVRPHTPRKIAVFNGIPVRGVRLLDATDVFPEYESALIESIRTHVEEKQEIVIVGGGRGVSSVVAAQQTNRQGEVLAFEASEDRCEIARETVQLNKLTQTITLRHAVVGPEISTAGTVGKAATIDPAELPDSDVLILDCEGSEIEIIQNLSSLPELILVETHGTLGTPENKVRRTLENRGYIVIDRCVENEADGVYILTAEKGSK